jgi:hypothetical protein
LNKSFASLFFLLFFLISSCINTKPISQEQTPTRNAGDSKQEIIVDDDHLQLQGFGQKFYEISAGTSVVLNTEGYSFRIPKMSGIDRPNMIQIVTSGKQVYSTAYNPEKYQYILSEQTLMPIGKGGPFNGFVSGQQIAIAIGYQDEQSRFSVLWVGMAKIK